MPADISLPDAAATLHVGEALAGGVAAGRVLHLRGELGTGKTTVVRGLLRGLGFTGRVKSPSYTLVEPYSVLRLNLYHFDFYRFKDRSEWVNSGFREHFGPESLCIVEWPDLAGQGLHPRHGGIEGRDQVPAVRREGPRAAGGRPGRRRVRARACGAERQ